MRSLVLCSNNRENFRQAWRSGRSFKDTKFPWVSQYGSGWRMEAQEPHQSVIRQKRIHTSLHCLSDRTGPAPAVCYQLSTRIWGVRALLGTSALVSASGSWSSASPSTNPPFAVPKPLPVPCQPNRSPEGCCGTTPQGARGGLDWHLLTESPGGLFLTPAKEIRRGTCKKPWVRSEAFWGAECGWVTSVAGECSHWLTQWAWEQGRLLQEPVQT